MSDEVRLGLKENAAQFTLLVIANAFVGGMIGLERSILPQLAEAEFQIAAKTALLSSIVGLQGLCSVGVRRWSIRRFFPPSLNTLTRRIERKTGVFRPWRDRGYPIGAILTVIVADLVSIPASIVLVAVLTIFSAFLIFRMSVVEVAA